MSAAGNFFVMPDSIRHPRIGYTPSLTWIAGQARNDKTR
jgi:hypothetical protein